MYRSHGPISQSLSTSVIFVHNLCFSEDYAIQMSGPFPDWERVICVTQSAAQLLTKQVSLPPSMNPAHIMLGVRTFPYDCWQSTWSMMFTAAFCSKLVREPVEMNDKIFF